MYKRKSSRKPIVRRRRAVRRIARPMRNMVNRHIFRRLANEVALVNSGEFPLWTANVNSSGGSPDDFGTTQTGCAFKFTLNDLIEANDFITLFDRYKILGVKLNFLYQANMAEQTSKAPLPIIHYSTDYDDATAPASEDKVKNKYNCKTKVLNANRTFSVYIKPRVAQNVYSASLTSAYGNIKAPFIDCTYSQVEHYGLKVWIRNWSAVSGTATSKLTVQPVYYLQCKDSQ